MTYNYDSAGVTGLFGQHHLLISANATEQAIVQVCRNRMVNQPNLHAPGINTVFVVESQAEFDDAVLSTIRDPNNV